MDLIAENIAKYCDNHTSPSDVILYELERETHLKTSAPQMLSGHLQGQLLYFISQMIEPKVIVEIGTFTGYSAICMARGLAKGGILHTIDIDAEMQPMINKYIEKADLQDKVQLHIGDAKAIIPTIDASIDLVFIDAAKKDYPIYFDLLIDKVRSGGWIIADNVLWKGKVVAEKQDKTTAALNAFNEKISADNRVENVLLPVRDGLLIIRKK